ncbi:MAG: TonB-dependent receptor [Hyphomicrobiaceae bacterium]
MLSLDDHGQSTPTLTRVARGLAAACSFATLSIVLAQGATAQQAPTLPEVTVETPKPQPKAVPPKAAPKAAAKRRARPPRQVAQPAPPLPPEPVETPPPLSPAEIAETARTGEARDAALQSQVYATPGAVSSVGTSEISTFGQSDLGDVLRSVPGTSVRESPNNPGVAVNIRGMEGSGRVNMMIDGVRQNFRFTGHEAQGFTYVDPSLLAGVDIARGTVSTAGGAGALAGAANFRTLDIIDVLKPGQRAGALSTASWGTNGQNWTGMQAGAVSNGRVGVIGAISGRNPDDFKNGDGVTVPFTGQDLTSGLIKGEFLLTEEQKIKIGGVFYRNDFVANSYDQTISSDIFTVNYHYKPVHTDLINLKVNAYRSDVTMEYLRPYIVSPFLSSSGRTINDLGTGFDVSNVSLFRLGGIKVRSEYGYEYFHDEVDSINSTLVPGRGVNPSGESSIAGAFSSTKFSYGIFDFITGLRYDQFTLKGSGSVAANDPIGLPTGPFTVDRDEGRFNPKVTLAARLSPWFTPYITYAEAMRAPTVSETFMGGNHPGAGPAQSFFPNPFLDPEIQKGWEIGFNTAVEHVFTARDLLRFKANYFNNDVENYITACFGITGGTFFCNNPGTSVIQGVELQGMYDTGFFFAGASYTWTDSDLPSQVNGLGGQSYNPEHVASLTAGVRFLKERLTLGARVYTASKAFIGVINAPDPTNPFTDGYTTLDLFTKFKITPDIEVGATVTNVTDEAFTPATSTPGTGGFIGDTGRGRTAIVTVRAKF